MRDQRGVVREGSGRFLPEDPGNAQHGRRADLLLYRTLSTNTVGALPARQIGAIRSRLLAIKPRKAGTCRPGLSTDSRSAHSGCDVTLNPAFGTPCKPAPSLSPKPARNAGGQDSQAHQPSISCHKATNSDFAAQDMFSRTGLPRWRQSTTKEPPDAGTV